MSNQPVECPLCYKNFSLSNIENHAQTCGEKVTLDSTSKLFKKQLKRKSDGQVIPEVKKLSSCTIVNTSKGKDSLMSPLPSSSSHLKESCFDTKNQEFNSGLNLTKPLADLARPTCLENYIGQSDVVGTETALYKLLEKNHVPSMVLWGPPGCGKTTLAHIISNNVKQHSSNSDDKIHFTKLSATDSGKADLQTVIKTAMKKQQMFKCKTILFIDEIHRFNKLQQDSLLPAVENGTVVLIGATTENPSFVLNSALLSRCRVILLHKLDVPHVKSILLQALKSCLSQVKIIEEASSYETSDDETICVEEASLNVLAALCDGDARTALNGLQIALQAVECTDSKVKIVNVELVKDCLQRTHFLYDKKGDQHYDLTSALHKSIRGGDDNASLYWLTRMIMGGEDPRFIARRLIRVASEDIGLADPNALNQAVSCYHACLYVGMPECDAALAQCVVYLARAPKSIEVYSALESAKKCIKEHSGPLPSVPLHLRNAPTKLMKDLNYGKGYRYNPVEDAEGQTYLPKQLLHVKFLN